MKKILTVLLILTFAFGSISFASAAPVASQGSVSFEKLWTDVSNEFYSYFTQEFNSYFTSSEKSRLCLNNKFVSDKAIAEAKTILEKTGTEKDAFIGAFGQYMVTYGVPSGVNGSTNMSNSKNIALAQRALSFVAASNGKKHLGQFYEIYMKHKNAIISEAKQHFTENGFQGIELYIQQNAQVIQQVVPAEFASIAPIIPSILAGYVENPNNQQYIYSLYNSILDSKASAKDKKVQLADAIYSVFGQIISGFMPGADISQYDSSLKGVAQSIAHDVVDKNMAYIGSTFPGQNTWILTGAAGLVVGAVIGILIGRKKKNQNTAA